MTERASSSTAPATRSGDRHIETRIELIEQGMRSLFGAIDELRTEMKAERTEIIAEFKSIRTDLSERARPFPIKEVVATAVAVTTVVTAIITGLDGWHTGKLEPFNDRVARLERSVSPAELAVKEYRLRQLEIAARINPITDPPVQLPR